MSMLVFYLSERTTQRVRSLPIDYRHLDISWLHLPSSFPSSSLLLLPFRYFQMHYQDDNCTRYLKRALQFTTPQFWDMSHKEISMALALHNAGFRLITILRHPIPREISNYNFIRYQLKKNLNDVLNETTLMEKILANPLVTALTRKRDFFNCDWTNCGLKACQRIVRQSTYAGNSSEGMLQYSLNLLKTKFAFVHCLEHGDKKLIEGLRTKVGIGLPGFPTVNSIAHADTVVLSREQVAYLRQHSLDYRVYLEFCGELPEYE
eukprot:m.62243 g.62243  ORF g.62243 m.62243 type:complete len:263 (-) comp49539_c0_seq1:79-867(-)